MRLIAPLIARPLDPVAFAPFGEVTPRVAATTGTVITPVGLFRNLRPETATPRLAWFSVTGGAWPLTVRVMERHRLSSQSFIPCGAADWLVLVAPGDATDGPDMGRAAAFVASADQAVTLAPDTWHHPLTALAPSSFAVLTSLAGDADDEEFRTLPAPVEIRAG